MNFKLPPIPKAPKIAKISSFKIPKVSNIPKISSGSSTGMKIPSMKMKVDTGGYRKNNKKMVMKNIIKTKFL